MNNKQGKTLKGIYMQNILTRKIVLPFLVLGGNIKELLSQKVAEMYEGKCIKEGFIKKKSCNIVSYSAGVLKNNNVVFDVLFECLVCKPAEGMKFKVTVKNITKAGIRAEYKQDSPIVVFISRDHAYKNKNLFDSFNSLRDEALEKIVNFESLNKLPKYKEPSKKVSYNFKNENVYINPIDYYFSNSISRSSKVMSECRDIKLKYQKSGTNN